MTGCGQRGPDPELYRREGKDPATGKGTTRVGVDQHGIADYVAEAAGQDTLTPVFSCESEAVGRDREDQECA